MQINPVTGEILGQVDIKLSNLEFQYTDRIKEQINLLKHILKDGLFKGSDLIATVCLIHAIQEDIDKLNDNDIQTKKGNKND